MILGARWERGVGRGLKSAGDAMSTDFLPGVNLKLADLFAGLA